MKQADTNRQNGSINSIMTDFWEGKLSKIHTFDIAMLFVCPCVSVCLSVAFKFLNHLTDCYKSDVNIMVTLGGHQNDLGYNSR